MTRKPESKQGETKMKRTDEDVVLVERDSGSSILWFLLGGVLGAGVALLFAPHSGDRTRRLLGRKITKLRDAADQALSDFKEVMKPAELKNESSREDEGESDSEAPLEPPSRVQAPEPRRGASGARRELEQRLAEARARRHKALADEDEEPIA